MLLAETHLGFSRLFPTVGFQIITEPSSPEDSPSTGSCKLSTRPANGAGSAPDSKRYFEESLAPLAPFRRLRAGGLIRGGARRPCSAGSRNRMASQIFWSACAGSWIKLAPVNRRSARRTAPEDASQSSGIEPVNGGDDGRSFAERRTAMLQSTRCPTVWKSVCHRLFRPTTS